MAKKITDHIEITDYVMIVQDGCIKHITYEDFIKQITLGGFSVTQAWLNGICGIGLFTTDETPPDTPPTMQDLFFAPPNRGSKAFTSDDFITKFYDAENDQFGKIIITAGDVSGYSLNGQPVYLGMMITADQLMDLEYKAKDQEAPYTQELYFDAYDENNVKAESI